MKNDMVELEPELEEFLNKNFQLVESKYNGRVKIYSSANILLSIEQDLNNFQFMEAASNKNPKRWFGLDIIRSYILNNDDYLNLVAFKVEYYFLMRNYNDIINLLSPENYSSAERALSVLEQKRAEIKYGRFGYKRPTKSDITASPQQQKPEKKEASKPWWKFW